MRLTLDNDCGPDGAPLRVIAELAEGERVIVGRNADAQIRCGVAGCSRHHCAFFVEGGELYVEDLLSAGGTWLNGKKVQRAQVAAGDVLLAGVPRLHVVAVERL